MTVAWIEVSFSQEFPLALPTLGGLAEDGEQLGFWSGQSWVQLRQALSLHIQVLALFSTPEYLPWQGPTEVEHSTQT